LSTERDALLPSSGSGARQSADSYEQSINQKVLTDEPLINKPVTQSRNWKRSWQAFNTATALAD